MTDVLDLCHEAAEAMVEKSLSEAHASRVNSLAERLQARLDAASDGEKEALLREYKSSIGEEGDEPKRGKKKANP